MLTPEKIEDLLKLAAEARSESLKRLLEDVKAGDASASTYMALLKAAKEVEEMVGKRAGDEARRKAAETAQSTPEVQSYEALGDYDPEAPLDTQGFH